MIDEKNRSLSKKSLLDFANVTSSESPAPGGGSISAYCGALAASLAVMVANLSAHKRGWDDKWEFFSKIGEEGMKIQSQLIDLVDEDTSPLNLANFKTKMQNTSKIPKCKIQLKCQNINLRRIFDIGFSPVPHSMFHNVSYALT